MRKLHRNTQGAVVGGVCRGIADYFNVDPTLVRLAWAVTIFLGGTGLLAYLVAWLIIPAQPQGDWAEPELMLDRELSTATDQPPDAGAAVDRSRPVERDRSGANTFGLILILIGGFWLVQNLVPHWGWQRYWPLALIAVGLCMIVGALRGNSRR